jgi:hypothetical protein
MLKNLPSLEKGYKLFFSLLHAPRGFVVALNGHVRAMTLLRHVGVKLLTSVLPAHCLNVSAVGSRLC